MDPKVNNFYSFTAEKNAAGEELSHYSTETSHPEFGKLPYNSGCIECMEILEKRTADERYFLKTGTNGKEFFVQKSFSPMHYKDAAGRWITIDPRIKSISAKIFSALQQPSPVEINLMEGFSSLHVLDKKIDFNQQVRTYFAKGDSELNSRQSSNEVFFTAGDDGVEQRNFLPGIYRQLIVERGSIKTNYVLQHQPEIPGNSNWMVFEDTWTLPERFKIKKSDDGFTTPDGIWIGDLVIVDENENEFFRVYKPLIYDSNIPDGNNSSPVIGYKIENKNGEWLLKVFVATNWLQSEKRI
jgi:hypothetical protein